MIINHYAVAYWYEKMAVLTVIVIEDNCRQGRGKCDNVIM